MTLLREPMRSVRFPIAGQLPRGIGGVEADSIYGIWGLVAWQVSRRRPL